MRKLKNKTVLASLISILTCTAIFVGVAFAWFSANVNNSGNKIKSGSIAIKLYQNDETGNYIDISKTSTPIFHKLDLVPDESVMADLKLEYSGTVSAKYYLKLNGLEKVNIDDSQEKAEAKGIHEILEVYLNGAYAGVLNDYINSDYAFIAGVFHNPSSIYLNIKIELPSWADNQYQGATLPEFDVVAYATQINNTSEGFPTTIGSNYTQKPMANEEPVVVNGKTSAPINVTAPKDTILETSTASVNVSEKVIDEFLKNLSDVPTNAEVVLTATTSLENINFLVMTDPFVSVAHIDLSLMIAGEPITNFVEPITVSMYIAAGLGSVIVEYNGVGDNPTDVVYDNITGLLTFKTTHFSEFIVKIVNATGISIKGNTGFGVVGETLQLTAELTPAKAVAKDIIWSSNNEEIAIVSNQGLVSFLNYGNVTINVATGTHSNSVNILVEQKSAQGNFLLDSALFGPLSEQNFAKVIGNGTALMEFYPTTKVGQPTWTLPSYTSMQYNKKDMTGTGTTRYAAVGINLTRLLEINPGFVYSSVSGTTGSIYNTAKAADINAGFDRMITIPVVGTTVSSSTDLSKWSVKTGVTTLVISLRLGTSSTYKKYQLAVTIAEIPVV